MPLLGSILRIFSGHRERRGDSTFGIVSAIAGAALLLPGAFCTVIAAADDSPPPLEQQVKAAFLFKFGGYVEWPDGTFPDKNAPLVIGVAGADALADELSQVVGGRTLNGRPVTTKRIRSGESLSNIHILFVGRSELGRLGELSARSMPVLAVTDMEKGLSQGGVINFVLTGNRVRFEISLDAARRNGLRIGAPLLAVAMRVQE